MRNATIGQERARLAMKPLLGIADELSALDILYFGPAMAQSTTISIRPEPANKARLDRLADSTRRSKSLLATEAVRAFVELNEWQIQEVHPALQEADTGDFATPTQIRKVLRKWRKAK